MGLELPNYGLSEEQLEFRAMLRRFLTEHLPMTGVRDAIDSESGVSDAVWREGCASLGWAGLAVDEAAGGQGFGLNELGVALSEVGRSLATVPLFSVAALVIPAIEAFATEDARAGFLAPLLAGDLASLAWVEMEGPRGTESGWSPAATETTVDSKGRLQGEKHFVLHGDAALRFFVLARQPGSAGLAGLVLVEVDAKAEGVVVESVESLDLTRRLARVRFENAQGEIVGAPMDGGLRFEALLERASTLLCAESVGSMERVLECAVDFAGSRQQFGRAIGSFQAIKHKAADMLIDFEGARTATDAALKASESQDAEEAILAAVADAHTAPAFVRMATENLQIHGGVGYTWEYDPHLYFRRAHSSALFLGDSARRLEELAHLLDAE